MKKRWGLVWGLSFLTGGLAALAWWKWPKHGKPGVPVDVNFPQATDLKQDVEPVVKQAAQVANQVLQHPAVQDGSHPNAVQAQDLANQALAAANQALSSPQGQQLANQAATAAQQAAALLFPQPPPAAQHAASPPPAAAKVFDPYAHLPGQASLQDNAHFDTPFAPGSDAAQAALMSAPATTLKEI